MSLICSKRLKFTPSWAMSMKYSNTRRHFLEHMWKLVGGVMPNTPSGGHELEHFTTYEAHRPNFICSICRCPIDHCVERAASGITLHTKCGIKLIAAIHANLAPSFSSTAMNGSRNPSSSWIIRRKRILHTSDELIIVINSKGDF